LLRHDRSRRKPAPVFSGSPRGGGGLEPGNAAYGLKRPLGEQLAKCGVLPELADRDERVALLDDVGRLGSGHGLRLAQDGDDRDPRPGSERAVGERATDRRAAVRNRYPLDRELAESHLQLLDDLRTIVGTAEDRAELACFLVVQRDDGAWILVVAGAEEVDLAHAVAVHDHRRPAAVGGIERVLDAD